MILRGEGEFWGFFSIPMEGLVFCHPPMIVEAVFIKWVVYFVCPLFKMVYNGKSILVAYGSKMEKNHEPNQYTAAIGAKGRIILPVALQRQANLLEGEKIVITLNEDGTINIVPLRACAKACEGMLSHLAPGVNFADELIAERHQAAEQEKRELGE